MPDTGAPWNIPYVAGTDLVADWPTDSQTLAEAIADGLDDATVAGIGTNVVQTVKTDTFTASLNSGVAAAVTGLTASITPTSATSKVLVFVDLNVSGAGGSLSQGLGVILKRASTAIGIGDAASSRGRFTAGGIQTADHAQNNIAIVHLDSPATTSSTTYSVEVVNGGSTSPFNIHVNRSNGDSDNSYVGRMASRITLVEVKA